MTPDSAVSRPQHIRRNTSAEAKNQTELRVRAAHLVLLHCQVQMSRAKISRLVRRFEVRVARNGWTFHEFLFNAANLTEDQRRNVMCHRTLARLLCYCDPTGEQAVNHVLHQRGY